MKNEEILYPKLLFPGYGITREVVEVKHGKIIETIEHGKHKRTFSCCGTDFTNLTMWYKPKYCPNCGAKMDG